jgi:hypothetical protein
VELDASDGFETGVVATDQCSALAESAGPLPVLAHRLGVVLSPPHVGGRAPALADATGLPAPVRAVDAWGFLRMARRLIAIDSKLFDVCETPETDWTLRGRTKDDQPRSASAFPQVRLLSALSIGSHAHLGAVLAPGFRSEMSLVPQRLRYLPPTSLVLQDSGFRGAWWRERLKQAGHDRITRLHTDDYACQGQRLCDGSYLVQVQCSPSVCPCPSP